MEAKLKDVKVGDKLTRILARKLHIPVYVSEVRGSVITVKPDIDKETMLSYMQKGKDWIEKISNREDDIQLMPEVVCWHFSMITGGEIDVDLGWDGINTGSVLIKPEENDSRPTEP